MKKEMKKGTGYFFCKDCHLIEDFDLSKCGLDESSPYIIKNNLLKGFDLSNP